MVRRLVLSCSVLLVVAGCGDDAAVTTSSAASTTVIATTAPSTTAATTTTVGVTTTAPPCAGLPSATIPAPGAGVTFQNGDFDGDSSTDQLIGYLGGDGLGRVQIALSYGWATEISTQPPTDPSIPEPGIALAAQQFAPGTPWVGLAQVGTGASTSVIEWLYLDGCSITPATIDGVGEASFILDGGVTEMLGMTCNPDGFTATSAFTGDFVNWEFNSSQHVWDPAAHTFHNLGMASSTLVSPADDAAIASAAAFSCPYGS